MASIKEALVDIDGKKFQLVSDDDYLDYIKTGFEPDMVKLFNTLVKNTDVVFDVGANIGCTALLFANTARMVYAFEPSPTTFAFLKQNIDRSGLTNIQLQNIGLGDTPGNYPLTFSPSNRAGGFVSNKTRASRGHNVETISLQTLDDITVSLNVPRVDFIKIDVEGFEGQVLRGACRVLESYRPIVVMELNHWCLNAFQRTSIPDFFDALRSLFPCLYAVDGSSYLNLHDESDSYTVMYHHIIHMRFPNLVAAFSKDRLDSFFHCHRNHFAG